MRVKKYLYNVIESECTDIFGMYCYVRKKFKDTSILESLGDYDESTSRYSIMGVIAKERLYHDTSNNSKNQKEHLLENVFSKEIKKVDWLDILDNWISIGEVTTDLPLQIGAIGYIGYENKYFFEKLLDCIPNDTKFPEIYLIRYGLIFVYDRKDKKGYWIADKDIEHTIYLEIEQNYKIQKDNDETFLVNDDFKSDYTKEQYIGMVNKSIKHIKKGDIFQANITVRHSGSYQGNCFKLYEYLRKTTANPFFAYLDFEKPLISTSPERFVLIKGNRISANPIKGTVKCKINGIDQEMFLKNSEKNTAENVMITDLTRNDIGRLCVQGSVDVKDLCAVKKFNNIYHMESLVDGILKKNIKISNVLKAIFPAGSITGAPKIKAMDIIESLELQKRGAYCGLVGFFGRDGWVDTSVAIRIIYFDDEKFYLHAGGGIVVDSVAEDEYEELLLKLERLIKALKKFQKNVSRE